MAHSRSKGRRTIAYTGEHTILHQSNPNKAKEEELAEEGEGDWWSLCSVEDYTRQQDKGGKSIRVNNKDKLTHPFGHGRFAQCGQTNIKAFHHHHGCKWQRI